MREIELLSLSRKGHLVAVLALEAELSFVVETAGV